MENFITTLVFLLPGFLLYFWIQTFGVNPVVKHTSIEVTAISALLWLPVSYSTLKIYNFIINFSNSNHLKIRTLNELQELTGDLSFLILFLFLSIIVSFAFAVIWSKWLFNVHLKIVNIIRKWRGAASFSKTPSVWDEVFLKNEPQVVKFSKIGEKQSIIGEIEKVSRTFEPEKNLYLYDVEYYTKLVEKHKIPVTRTFIDTRTGTYVQLYDSRSVKEAIDSENTTSV